jgi:hypothetical protein
MRHRNLCHRDEALGWHRRGRCSRSRTRCTSCSLLTNVLKIQVPQTIPLGIVFGSLHDILAHEDGSSSFPFSTDKQHRIAYPSKPSHFPTPHAHFITPTDSQPDFALETAEHVVRRHLALAHHKPLTTYLPSAARTVQIHDPTVFPPGLGTTGRA